MNKLQEACIISHEHWLNEIEQSIASIDIEIPEIKIPEKAKEKILSIKDYKTENKKNRVIGKKVIKILIIAAIIISLLMSVSAFTPFREFVIEFFDDYNLFTNNIYEMHYPKGIEITNLPEGFVLIGEDVGKRIIMQEYKCDEKSFIISKNTPDTHFQVSNEYLEEIFFYDNDIQYSLFVLTNKCTEIIWLTDEYSYVLTGFNMTNEEMIELAKSIS